MMAWPDDGGGGGSGGDDDDDDDHQSFPLASFVRFLRTHMFIYYQAAGC